MENNRINWLAVAILAISPLHFLLSQTLPIAIDGQFGDWTSAASGLEDPGGGGAGIDLLRMAVANDGDYLFIRFELDQEVVLTDGNDLTLFIDGDQNSATGKPINGIGAELELRLGDRDGIFYHGNSTYYHDLGGVGFVGLPSFSAKIFELAIRRDAKPDGVFPVFSGNKARVFIQNGLSGDKMPNAGQTFSYTFDTSAAPAYLPISLEKNSPSYLRLMTWNTLADGLLDIVRKASFQRIVHAINPDIITFNECWDMTAAQAKTFMNTALPLASGQSWNTVKLESGNITVSRYPVLQSWNIYPGHRLVASLIDLPDGQFDKDILVINGHLRCCAANSERQLEADAFAKFILDAKSPGGLIDLPENTPFVLSGDMNLVGWQQQYTTLLTGDIQNTNANGDGAPLDWDGSPLQDVLALQTDQRMAYTWREEGSQYPPSRLDYHICSNSVLEVKKAFVLNTDIMPQYRLSAYSLLQHDNRTASDHLPKVTDFVVTPLTGTSVVSTRNPIIKLYPNPASDAFQLITNLPQNGVFKLTLFNIQGQVIRQWDLPTIQQQQGFSLLGIPNGMYFWQIQSSDFPFSSGKIKVQHF